MHRQRASQKDTAGDLPVQVTRSLAGGQCLFERLLGGPQLADMPVSDAQAKRHIAALGQVICRQQFQRLVRFFDQPLAITQALRQKHFSSGDLSQGELVFLG